MLLHLGGGFSVDSRQVVMLIDLQKPPAAGTQALMEGLARQGRLRRLKGRGATLALCQQGAEGLYGILSPIGLRTLRLRAQPPQGAMLSFERDGASL